MTTLKNLSVVLAAAVVAAMIAGPLLQPADVGAGEESDAVAAKVLVVDGVKLSIEAGKSPLKAGVKPVLTVCAMNPGDAAKSVEVEIVVSRSSLADSLSRVMLPGAKAWTKCVPLSLAAGATKQVKVECETAVESGDTVTYSLRSVEEKVREVMISSIFVAFEKIEEPAETPK